MKQLIILGMLLIGSVANAQLQVSIGYQVPLDDDYGMAYLAVGDRLGGYLGIGGDSKISYGNEKKGNGYVSGGLFYNVIDNRDGFSFRVSAGIGSREEYKAHDQYIVGPDGTKYLDPNYGKPELVGSTQGVEGSIGVSWKFIEVMYTSNNEIGFGFKLTR